MSSNQIERVATPAAAVPAHVGQATAIEQSRAVAEVQAAVVVAQQCPRDMKRAEDEMHDACRRPALASRAFYSVPNRGNGPSVHLARELARIFGNIQYGVHELSRDDAAGQSEILAFAWDVQTNTRSTRTFIVPHARMSNRQRQKLTDLGDIYLSNQNAGARAVRECIFTVLPTWFTEEAKELCHKTLAGGSAGELAEKFERAVKAFERRGVTLRQLEDKLGVKRPEWTGDEFAQLDVLFASLKRGEITIDEAFPKARVTADEILDVEDPPGDDGGWGPVAQPGGAR